MEFGKTISSFREKWGIEQKDLANAIGVSRTYISIVESGKRKPSMRMLNKIAHYFEVPLAYLVYQSSKSSGSIKGKKALEKVDPIIQELANFLLTSGQKKKIGVPKKRKKIGKKKG